MTNLFFAHIVIKKSAKPFQKRIFAKNLNSDKTPRQIQYMYHFPLKKNYFCQCTADQCSTYKQLSLGQYNGNICKKVSARKVSGKNLGKKLWKKVRILSSPWNKMSLEIKSCVLDSWDYRGCQ